MWQRVRRRSMGPSRDAFEPRNAGLIVFSVAALGSGIYIAVRVFFG